MAVTMDPLYVHVIKLKPWPNLSTLCDEPWTVIMPSMLHFCSTKQSNASNSILDRKAHGVNMGPIWGRQDPGGPHVSRMNFAIWDAFYLRDVPCKPTVEPGIDDHECLWYTIQMIVPY